MSANTKIEWADDTWNPVTGCTEVSPGCDHCYAKTFAERWRGTPGHYFEHGFDIQLRHDKLELPLQWRRPRRIFVNSMSDLFHDEVPNDYIASVFAVMALSPQHTFQILTKRHGRMQSLINGDLYDRMVNAWTFDEGQKFVWPLPNVWLGVSVENQRWANIRTPVLLDTQAAVRFVSAEPLLGPIDFYDCPISALRPDWVGSSAGGTGAPHPLLDWVIVGGESGRGARPMQTDWVRSIRDQCIDARTPFLFKQWGEYGIQGWAALKPDLCGEVNGPIVKMGKRLTGRHLDGRTWDQYPEAVKTVA